MSQNPFAQSIFETRLRVSPNAILSRLLNGLFRAIPTAMTSEVRYKIGAYDVWLPFSHAMPFYRRTFPLYDTGIGRLARLVSNKYPKSSMVDIGANIGDTAAVMRSESSLPLLCIEGNPAFTSLLRRNIMAFGANVFVEEVMLDASTGVASGTILTTNGTARIVNSGQSVFCFHSLADVMARHPTFPNPRLIKVDTDGFDLPIIEGSSSILVNDKPVIFFEFVPDFYDDARIGSFWGVLAGLGYAQAVVLTNTGEYDRSLDIGCATDCLDLSLRYKGLGVTQYADLAVFSQSDLDLAAQFRRGEIDLTLKNRQERQAHYASAH